MSKNNRDSLSLSGEMVNSSFCFVEIDALSEVTDYVANGSFATIKENVTYHDEPNYALLLRVTDFSKGWNGKYKYVDEHAYNFLAKSSVVPGDLVIANVGEPGKLFLAPDLGMPMTLAPNAILVKPTKFLLNKYAAYFLESPEGKRLIDGIVTGTAQQKFNKTSFRKLKIPVASIGYQQAIVSKIEELFSHIDAGVEGLKQAKAKLQQYRQSVLKDAVTGKLTEQWREQNADKLEPAEHLLERILDERRANWEAEQLKAFEEKGKTPKNDKWKEKYKEPPQADMSSLPEIPDSWTWTTITQLGELNRGKSKHRPRNDPSLYGGDYPFVQTGDVRAADGLLTTYKQTYSEKGLAQSRLWPKGTICITIAANIAETAILGIDACFPDSVVGFIPQNEGVLVEYIEFFFRTAREDLDRYAPATAQKNINLAILETVSVPFMSIEEQKELVLQVTEKLEATNRAETTIDEKIQHSASLKSSILAKAFSGELVPNSCAENALELLENIKAEKETMAETKPTRSTKRKKK